MNKLELHRKLNGLRLNDGGSVTHHLKSMAVIFNELSIIGDPIKEEDRVVHILANLPDSFSMLVKALQANADVPHVEVVTERLLHEETRLLEKSAVHKSDSENSLAAGHNKFNKKKATCHHYGETGYMKKNCWHLHGKPDKKNDFSHSSKNFEKVNKVGHNSCKRDNSSSSSSSVGLLASHALKVSGNYNRDVWLADSGATSHMCNDEKFFRNLKSLPSVEKVSLGDNYELDGTHIG